MTASLDAVRAPTRITPAMSGAFTPIPLTLHTPVTARHLPYGPDRVDFSDGIFATEKTHVSFGGTTEWGGASDFSSM